MALAIVRAVGKAGAAAAAHALEKHGVHTVGIAEEIGVAGTMGLAMFGSGAAINALIEARREKHRLRHLARK